jgi:hypothetical protein
MNKSALGSALILALFCCRAAIPADEPAHQHQHREDPVAAASATKPMPRDSRQLVNYPTALRIHTLANMRDHLQTMGDIQEALSKGSFDKASELAEQRLGMSSLEMHGAHAVTKYMPKGMQDAGSAMHHSASKFALVAKDASVTGDLKGALASLHQLNQTCVACHAAFRLQ